MRAAEQAQTVQRFLPSEYGVNHSSAVANVPEIVGTRIKIVKEIEHAGLPYTLIHI